MSIKIQFLNKKGRGEGRVTFSFFLSLFKLSVVGSRGLSSAYFVCKSTWLKRSLICDIDGQDIATTALLKASVQVTD